MLDTNIIKYKLLLMLIISLSPLLLLAQQQREDQSLQVSGTIVNAENQPIPFATVSIVSSGKGVVSDEEGFFFIKFLQKDSLVISTVAHAPQYLYFGDTATTDNYDLKIRLSEQTYTLEEVTVFAFKDAYAFKKAVLELDDLPEEQEQIHVPGSYYGPRKEVKASPLSPVSFVADRLSKRARYEREAREKIAASKQSNALAQKYNRELVGKITGLKEEKLDEFMVYCRMKEVFVDRPNEYEVVLAINQCYNDFKTEQSMQ